MRIRRGAWRALILATVVVLGAGCVYFVAEEMRTSQLQARYLAQLGQELTFRMQPGPSASVRFPQTGPYDHRLGYAQLPGYLERLRERGYTVVAQATLSPRMAQVGELGRHLPYPEKNQAGLSVLDCNARPIYATRFPERVYAGFEAVPSVLGCATPTGSDGRAAEVAWPRLRQGSRAFADLHKALSWSQAYLGDRHLLAGTLEFGRELRAQFRRSDSC